MSVLPPPQKDGEIKFLMAKGLPYRRRMALVGLLLASGLGLQVTAGFWPGFIVLIFAQLLGMNTGYDASPRKTGSEDWVRVSPDEYEKVRLRAEQLKSWDEDFFDATSTSGLIGFVAVIIVCAVAYGIADAAWNFPEGYWIFFGLDAAVLLLPLWLIGTRQYLKKDRLLIKIDMLRGIMKEFNDPSDVQVQPMLSLAATKSGGKEPMDARLMIKMVGAPQELYGVQVQLSINSVQGKDYPYLYCVLIAKKGKGLLNGYKDLLKRPEQSFMRSLSGFILGGLRGAGGGAVDLVYEPSSTGEVDIIVVRRRTTRSGGYFTPPDAALSIVKNSVDLARALAVRPPPPRGL